MIFIFLILSVDKCFCFTSIVAPHIDPGVSCMQRIMAWYGGIIYGMEDHGKEWRDQYQLS